MKVVVRAIQKVAVGKWEEKEELEKRFDAVENRLGGAAVRHYRCQFSGDPSETYVKEFEYESLAAVEDFNNRFSADPEWQALSEEDEERGITVEHRYELLRLLW